MSSYTIPPSDRDQPALPGTTDAQYRAVFEAADIGICRVRMDGTILETNEAFARILGSTPPELAGRNVWDITHPDDLALDQEMAALVLSGARSSYRIEKRYVRDDGGVVWVTLNASLVRDADGLPIFCVGIVQDITDRRRAEEALQASEATARERMQEIEELYHNAPVGLCVLDRELRWVRINERLAEINGFPPEAHIGQRVADLLPGVAVNAVPLAQQVMDTGIPVLGQELVGETPAQPGVRRTWIANWLPRRDASGAIIGINVTAEEVTAHRNAEAERERLFRDAEEARAKAEEASRAKSEFLAVMSHELRTPLNAILGYQDLLEVGVAGELTDAQRAYVSRVRASARHLLSLINRVLAFSRLDAGVVEYDVRELEAAELVAAAEPLVAPQVSEKGLVFTVNAGPSSLRVRADAEKTVQVLLNLLSNAVKFTGARGTVSLRVHARDAHCVAFEVADDGEGIPEALHETIFEPFRQVDSHYARRTAGTGLGLSIARALARGMGGDVTVASVPGAGATFTFTLPRA